MWMVIRTTDLWNVRLGNVLHVDLKITSLSKSTEKNEKQQKEVYFNEKGSRACNNGKNNSDKKIYAYMGRMYGNEKCPSGNFGDSSQLTNWILDSGTTCHMTLEVTDLFQVC